MDRIRHAAETVVRRIAVAGLLVIATVVATLLRQPRLAFDAVAVLLSVEALVLWQLGNSAPWLNFGRAPAWLTLPGAGRRSRTIYAALLAETFRTYALRFAVPAALAWAADIAAHAA